MTVSFIWHIHQSFFIPDSEIKDKTIESYQNLIAVHEEFEVPFCLNVTGVLLERLINIEPEFVERIKDLLKDGLIELTASAYGHPLLPLLPYERAEVHISRDIDIKKKIFKVTPSGFWPTELGWTYWLIPLLKKFKIKWIVVDSYSLLQSNALPEWKSKKVLGMKILLPEIKTVTLRHEIYRPYVARFLDQELFVILRDHELSEKLIEFKTGVIYNEKLIDGYVEKVVNTRGFLVIGNDGEKINAQTARVYRKLIEELVNREVDFKTPSQYLEINDNEIEERYFPASTFQYNLDPWISTMDDEVYLLFLHHIYEKLETLKLLSKFYNSKRLKELLSKAENALLNAEDSGCIFWKFLKRTRKPCYESAYMALLYVQEALEALLWKS